MMLPRIKIKPTFLIVIVIILDIIFRRKNVVSHPKLQCSNTVLQPVDTSFTRVIGQHCYWIYHGMSLYQCCVVSSWLLFQLWYYCERIKPRRRIVVSLRVVIKSIDIHGESVVVLPKRRLYPILLPLVFVAF
jgi:hypothetical protein